LKKYLTIINARVIIYIEIERDKKLNRRRKMIYKDTLGFLVGRACISGYGNKDKQRWYVSGTIVDPEEISFNGKSYQEARDYLRSKGFICPDTAGTPGYASVFFGVDHPETLAEIERLKVVQDKKWKDARSCYVRYGKLPPGRRSRNHADDSLEDGVSVYRGLILPDKQARCLPSTNAELCGTMMLRSRPLYEITGDLIGTGSDGEPVLKNAKIVSKVVDAD